MEERAYKVTGTKEVFGNLPAQKFTAKVGPEDDADMTEEQAAALIQGGHIKAINATPSGGKE